jgi:hypothetical protein
MKDLVSLCLWGLKSAARRQLHICGGSRMRSSQVFHYTTLNMEPEEDLRSAQLESPSFELLKSSNTVSNLRNGRLHFPGRQTINTPHYIAITSRGAVSHLSQDTMRDCTAIKGLYVGLEDCELNNAQSNHLLKFQNHADPS